MLTSMSENIQHTINELNHLSHWRGCNEGWFFWCLLLSLYQGPPSAKFFLVEKWLQLDVTTKNLLAFFFTTLWGICPVTGLSFIFSLSSCIGILSRATGIVEYRWWAAKINFIFKFYLYFPKGKQLSERAREAFFDLLSSCHEVTFRCHVVF